MFGGRAPKCVKSNRSGIGSVTTIERAFPMDKEIRTSVPQASAIAAAATQSGKRTHFRGEGYTGGLAEAEIEQSNQFRLHLTD